MCCGGARRRVAALQAQSRKENLGKELMWDRVKHMCWDAMSARGMRITVPSPAFMLLIIIMLFC